MTHFMDDSRPGRTLCGKRWNSIIMNERPATCEKCSDAHAAAGWTFPLPLTVSYEKDET